MLETVTLSERGLKGRQGVVHEFYKVISVSRASPLRSNEFALSRGRRACTASVMSVARPPSASADRPAPDRPFFETRTPNRDFVESSTRQNLAIAVKSAGFSQSLHSQT